MLESSAIFRSEPLLIWAWRVPFPWRLRPNLLSLTRILEILEKRRDSRIYWRSLGKHMRAFSVCGRMRIQEYLFSNRLVGNTGSFPTSGDRTSFFLLAAEKK